ncbi:MAG: VWA domain-containing protein [Deltaproteobacteria bacterium]|nr:VWA domain-containing protein [Deltaproteobacteria bacterium]
MLKRALGVSHKRSTFMVGLGLAATLAACGKTNFGEQVVQTDPALTNSGPKGADATKEQLPYGTPPTSEVEKSGWVTPEVRNAVDALLGRSEVTITVDGPGGNGGPGGGGGDNPGNGPGGAPGANGGGGDGPGPNDSIVSQTDGLLWLTCTENGGDAGLFKSEFFGKKGSKVRVAGEFCPTAKIQGDVTVLFLIDHSGSMEGAPNEGPNDKTTNGTCGRLQAAQSLVDAYAKLSLINVKAGVVGFSSGARVQVPVGGMDQLKANLKPEVFCGSDGRFAFTNYAAALQTAQQQLASTPGQKVVYLISDGSPTVGGTDPKASGVAAAQALRTIPDTSLYALFVGYKGDQASNPRGYLEQITGDAGLVRVTSGAADLVNAAKRLGTIPIKIKLEDTKGSLENPAGTTEITIEAMDQRKDAPDRFVWRSAPFELVGTPGGAALNKFTVMTVSSHGDKLNSVAEITYHEKP